MGGPGSGRRKGSGHGSKAITGSQKGSTLKSLYKTYGKTKGKAIFNQYAKNTHQKKMK